MQPQTLHHPAGYGIASVVINGVPQGETLFDIRDDDILVPVRFLRETVLRWESGREEVIAGEAFVSLRSLVPAIRFELDQREIVLNLTAPPEAFSSRTVLEPRRRSPITRSPGGPSAFFNYGLNWQRDRRAGYAGELGVSLGKMLLRSSAFRSDMGSIERGPTVLTVDDQPRMLRWDAGDTLISSPYGGGTAVAGMTLSRALELDPYFIQYSPLTLRGTTAMPATAEVYVNGQLVDRYRVTPGLFELRDLAVPLGAGTTRLVLRDDLGGEREIVETYYRAPTVLRRGLQQFQYGMGLRRAKEQSARGLYSGAVAAGRHRWGVSDLVTVGGHAQIAQELISAGVEAALRTAFGELEIGSSGSRAAGRAGVGALASYGFRGRRSSFGVSARSVSRNFQEMGLETEAARPKYSLQAYFGTTLSRLAISTQHTELRDWTGSHRRRSGTTVTIPFKGGTNVLLSLYRSDGDRHERREGSLTLAIPLGSRSTANAAIGTTSTSPAEARVAIQRSLPRGPGYGYRVQWQAPSQSAALAVMGQNQFGRAEFRRDIAGQEAFDSANVAGAVALIGGGIHLTRPVDDAFALLRVPGVPRIRGYAGNQYVGRTNRRGELLVPSLASYYSNRVSINPDDVPVEYDLDRDVAIVAPSRRAGAVVTFSTNRVRLVSGRLIVQRGQQTLVPTFAELAVTSRRLSEVSAVGANGEFLFEGLAAGSHRAELRYEGQRYACELTVPGQANDLLVDVGVVRCLGSSGQASAPGER